MGYTMRAERYRYTVWVNWKTKAAVAYELYDHQTDPHENVNLALQSQYQSLLIKLEAQRQAGWQAAEMIYAARITHTCGSSELKTAPLSPLNPECEIAF
jgi:hypothetical protein